MIREKKRTARLDIRLPPVDKAYLERMASEKSRTLTGMVQDWLDAAISEHKKGTPPWLKS